MPSWCIFDGRLAAIEGQEQLAVAVRSAPTHCCHLILCLRLIFPTHNPFFFYFVVSRLLLSVLAHYALLSSIDSVCVYCFFFLFSLMSFPLFPSITRVFLTMPLLLSSTLSGSSFRFSSLNIFRRSLPSHWYITYKQQQCFSYFCA